MNRLTDQDKKLFAEYPILIDHLFNKPDGRRCNLAFYRDLAKQASEVLENTHLLSTEDPSRQGVTGDWTSRETTTASAIKRHVHAMIEKEASSLATKLDHVCHAYARLVLDHEDDKSCDEILRGLRRQYPGLHSIPAEGTCP